MLFYCITVHSKVNFINWTTLTWVTQYFQTCQLWYISDILKHDYQCLSTGWWLFLGTLVSSTNKTDSHDIAEILLKVALNSIILTLLKLISHFDFIDNTSVLHVPDKRTISIFTEIYLWKRYMLFSAHGLKKMFHLILFM